MFVVARCTACITMQCDTMGVAQSICIGVCHPSMMVVCALRLASAGTVLAFHHPHPSTLLAACNCQLQSCVGTPSLGYALAAAAAAAAHMCHALACLGPHHVMLTVPMLLLLLCNHLSFLSSLVQYGNDMPGTCPSSRPLLIKPWFQAVYTRGN